MSNENDDATQLGSIRHYTNKPQQPGNPQARSKPANASAGAKRRR